MIQRFAVVVGAALLLAGCATGRNYQSDVDALNAKIDSLQGQLETKNREIAALQDQVRAMRGQLQACTTQLELAGRAKTDCESRLNDALNRLGSSSTRGSQTTTTATKVQQSPIK